MFDVRRLMFSKFPLCVGNVFAPTMALVLKVGSDNRTAIPYRIALKQRYRKSFRQTYIPTGVDARMQVFMHTANAFTLTQTGRMHQKS